jgi:hypothetical protein
VTITGFHVKASFGNVKQSGFRDQDGCGKALSQVLRLGGFMSCARIKLQMIWFANLQASLFCLLVFVAMVLPSGLHSNSLPSQCQHEPSEFHWNVQQSAPHTQHYTSLHIHARSTTGRHLSVAWRTFHTHQATLSYTILHHAAAPAGTGAMIVETAHAEVQPGATQTGVDSTISTCFWMSSWGFMGFMGHWNFNKFHMS